MKAKWSKIIYAIIIIVIVGYFYVSINDADKVKEEESYNILKDAIIRSAVQCYAIEGYYPPDIEYLENHYGLIVDHDKYIVNYNIFASNIMPEIDIFKK